MPAPLSRGNFPARAGLLLTFTLSVPYLVVLGAIGSTIVQRRGIPPEIFDAKSLALVWSSVKLSLLVALASLAAGALLIGLLWKIKSTGARFSMLMALGLLFCLSPVIHLIGWRSAPVFAYLPPMFSTCGVMTWRAFPVMTFMLLMGIAALDRPGLEMAMLHAGWGDVLRKIVLPRLLPVAAMGGMTVFVLTFMEGEVPPLIGIRVYPEEFMGRIALESSLGGAAMGAIPFFLVAILSLAIILGLWPKGLQLSWQQNGIAVLDRYAKECGMPGVAAALAVAALLAPVVLLLKAAGNESFFEFVAKNGAAIWTSFKLGIVSALLTLVVGYILTDLILPAGKTVQVLILGALAGQIFLPGALLGLGMIELTHIPGLGWLNNGNILLVVTHCLRQVPFVVLLLVWLRGLDINQNRDELQLIGASWLNVLRHIRLPREWPRLVVIAGMALVLDLSELASTILVVAPGTETIILRLYNLMHYGDREGVAALAFVQALLTVLLLTLPILLLRRVRRDSH